MKLFTLLCVATFMLCTSIAYAEPADVLRVDDGLWLCFDGNGDVAFMENRWQRVDTNSDTGEITYRAHGECDGALPTGGAVHFETYHLGFICAFDAPYFQYVMTPSGKASYKCQNWPFD